MQSRDQIYQSLLPQYTQQIGGQVSPNQFTDPKTGQVITIADPAKFFSDLAANSDQYGYDDSIARAMSFEQDPVKRLKFIGYTPYSTPSSQSVDYSALNAAVEARLADQDTPDGYGSLLERFDLSKFQEDPSYQYRQDQSNKALERAMAAQGVTLGGGGYGTINPQVASALQEQNQNLASQEYGSAYDRYNLDKASLYSMLMGASGLGQNATNTMAGAGTNYANSATDLYTSLAGAQQNAAIAKASRPSMFGQILGAGAQVAGAYFSDSRLKNNIVHVGKKNGHNIYEFNYKDGSGRYRGVLADEVLLVEPDAVFTHNSGFMMVNYDAIGIPMERV